jgi:glycosyltransferase involved in cell wall biosynthesis
MSSHLAIVPALNEAGSIGQIVEEIRRHAEDFDVLVIDDGSTDETAAIAAAAGARVISMPFNVGIGGAVQCGYLYARDNGYTVAVQVDGDGQHDPRDIPRLLAALHEEPPVEMATGSRFLGERGDGDGDGYRPSPLRRSAMRLFATLVSLITGQRVTDATSGFRMSGRRGIELFALDYPHDYPEVEAILLLHANRLRMREVEVTMRARTSGRSTIVRGLQVYYMAKVLFAVAVGLLRQRPRPRPGRS